MQIEGITIMIGETSTFGNNGFRKRELVVETQEQYPQKILIEFVQDKVDLLDNYVEGEDVKVSINLRGREWTSPQGETKYFNTIQGWRIEKVGGQSATQSAPPKQQELPNEPNLPTDNLDPEDEEDDLPF